MTPKKICLYTSPAWKQSLFRKALASSLEHTFDVGRLIKETMADPAMKPLGQQVASYVSKIAGDIKMLSETDQQRFRVALDEKEYLQSARWYLREVFSCDVEVYRAEDTDLYDPAKKTRVAAPLRPAIYIE
jgi:leucyl-tRNA synthetase